MPGLFSRIHLLLLGCTLTFARCSDYTCLGNSFAFSEDPSLWFESPPPSLLTTIVSVERGLNMPLLAELCAPASRELKDFLNSTAVEPSLRPEKPMKKER